MHAYMMKLVLFFMYKKLSFPNNNVNGLVAECGKRNWRQAYLATQGRAQLVIPAQNVSI